MHCSVVPELDQDVVAHVAEDVGDVGVEVALQREQCLQVGGVQLPPRLVQPRQHRGQVRDDGLVRVPAAVHLLARGLHPRLRAAPARAGGLQLLQLEGVSVHLHPLDLALVDPPLDLSELLPVGHHGDDDLLLERLHVG